MKVPYVHGPGDLRIDEVPMPSVGARDILIRPATVGICGSDIGYVVTGAVGGRVGIPLPLGHELTGIVQAVGAETEGYAIGDSVIVNPYHNFIGNGGPEGGFADFLLIRDVAGQPGSLIAMPSSLSFESGALVEPLAVALHSLNRTEARPGDRVALFGAGPIGLAMVALMRHRGINDVVVFDPSPMRRDRAIALGARVTANPKEKAPVDVLADAHGTAPAYGQSFVGTDIFIDAAGASDIAEGILRIARIGASLTLVAVQKESVVVPLQVLLAKELTIRGALGYPTEFEAALSLLAEGFNLSEIVTHRFSSERVAEAFTVAARPAEAIKVLVNYAG